MMKLSQIRSFVTVARCGKFSQAAEELQLAQPTVSHAIATLEDELGIQLLFRGSKGVRLTPAGESILVRCDRILETLTEIQQEAERHKTLERGKIRISTFRGAAAQLLPKIRADFKANYPQIEVKIVEEADCPQVENAIREGKADLGFTTLPIPEDMEAVEIVCDRYVLLLPPNSQLKQTKKLTWQQLNSIPIISYPDRNSCFIAIAEYFQNAGYQFQPCEQVKESDTIVKLVAAGEGAAILPELSVFHLPEGVKVCQLPQPLERTVVAATLTNCNLSYAVWAWLDFLKQHNL
ncbi:LysR family transcriptional regulator [Myxosarcina sp. GI1]|uniref:LysR family transcriptional regulator n=1 Tax=Myxosarcina sp. GI1 TaxID=1541065 RepID=UPI0009E06309|nr:LysR family transcriptional regulator [Myxosarcina sp. GI1]